MDNRVYAFLIASDVKKENWKSYINKETKTSIKWIENTTEICKDRYCIIAIKAFIEKREETYGEIEDDYPDQVNGAKKVFVFHVKTGTSHVKNMINERGNLYYGVIDLDPTNGDPVKSIHNKLIIEDFNHQLFSLIDEQVTLGSTKRDAVCQKRGEGRWRWYMLIGFAIPAVILIAIFVPVFTIKT